MKFISICTLLSLIIVVQGFADPVRGKIPKNDGKSSTLQSTNSTTNAANTPNQAQCPQNDVLSKLLLQLLLSSVTTTTTQNPLVEGLNRLLGINPSPGSPKAQTTVITSTAVSTVTQVFSTVLSVMFKAKRIPTTIYSSSVVTVTELQTVTSTIPSSEPTALFRLARDVNSLETSLESSVNEPSPESIEPTQPLLLMNDGLTSYTHNSPSSSEDASYWMAVLSHPEVQQAWEQFLEVLHKVRADI